MVGDMRKMGKKNMEGGRRTAMSEMGNKKSRGGRRELIGVYDSQSYPGSFRLVDTLGYYSKHIWKPFHPTVLCGLCLLYMYICNVPNPARNYPVSKHPASLNPASNRAF